MLKTLYFFLAWSGGIIVLNQFMFKLLFQFIKDENAVAILCVLILSVYTVVLGFIVGRKHA